jgi:chromosome segregation ATPase
MQGEHARELDEAKAKMEESIAGAIQKGEEALAEEKGRHEREMAGAAERAQAEAREALEAAERAQEEAMSEQKGKHAEEVGALSERHRLEVEGLEERRQGELSALNATVESLKSKVLSLEDALSGLERDLSGARGEAERLRVELKESEKQHEVDMVRLRTSVSSPNHEFLPSFPKDVPGNVEKSRPTWRRSFTTTLNPKT